MDKLFKAIGNFFKKIWEWIKSTAWIQPLLIVSVIFGIIFSINPIVNAIKSAASSDKTGEFYSDKALNKAFNELFIGIPDQGNDYARRVRRNKLLVTEDSGDVLVIYVKGNTLEDDVKHFYNSAKVNGCKLYIVNFDDEKNQRSKYDPDHKLFEDKYEDDDGATYYEFLLEQFEESYSRSHVIGTDKTTGKDVTWGEYNEIFNKKYGYDIYYPSFKGQNLEGEYNTTSQGGKDAHQDIHLPAAVKYHNGNVIDMRFGNSSSWVDYDTKNSNPDNQIILQNMWEGAFENIELK